MAAERGPIVLCLESPDLPDGVPIETIRVRPDRAMQDHLDGARVQLEVAQLSTASTSTVPFGSEQSVSAERTIEVPLVPYHRWAERGPSTMRVFIPTSAG